VVSLSLAQNRNHKYFSSILVLKFGAILHSHPKAQQQIHFSLPLANLMRIFTQSWFLSTAF